MTKTSLGVPAYPVVADLEWEYDEAAKSWHAEDPFSGVYQIIHGSDDGFELCFSDHEKKKMNFPSLREARKQPMKIIVRRSSEFSELRNLPIAESERISHSFYGD